MKRTSDLHLGERVDNLSMLEILGKVYCPRRKASCAAYLQQYL